MTRARIVLALALLVGTSFAACRRTADLSPEAYREAVVAFHTALAAMDTSQEVLAREKLERVTALAPQEPAGWANLGLLLLRQQDIPAARERLARAASLAEDSAAIVRLQALAESRAGNLEEAIRLWRRALELAPSDTKAAYALAQDTERLGGAEREADAQRVLADLLAQENNLPARLDYARLAAKRGDAAALADALAPLSAIAAAWPEAARERLAAVTDAARTNPRAAATQIAFLRNVLAREPIYRRALARITTPLDAIGEPLTRFLVLPATAQTAAPADTAMTFAVTPVERPGSHRVVSAIPVDDDGKESIVSVADNGDVYLDDRVIGRAPGLRGTPAALLPVDLDNDFRLDLVLVGSHGLTLLRRTDDGLADVTSTSGLPSALLTQPTTGAWPADVDLDGDLDLVVAPTHQPSFVARNNGDGTFAVLRPFDACGQVVAFAWADMDGEGVPDAVCLDDAGQVHVLLNMRGGVFDATPLPASPSPASAAAVADLSGDGQPEIVIVANSGVVHVLELDLELATGPTIPANAWRWRDAINTRVAVPAATQVTQLHVADLDNNGALDLALTADTGTAVLLASETGSLSALPSFLPMRTAGVADLDNDGRLDLVGLDDTRVVQARNQGTKPYRWQRLRPRAATATGDQRINAFGIGGEVEVRTGLRTQTRHITGPVVHLGLGEAATSDIVRILWPNGVLQSEFEKPADATIRADQRLKGSCPWLFAWNGREMAFVTDLIWRSPLGLRINAQDTADASTTEDWVRVEGRQLVPRDGAYDLRVTAELWETHFFDMVSLAVVDHPVGTEVFVDERFAVPAPSLAPVVTGPLQAFAAVVDDTGRDVREIVAARDDVHLDFAGRGRYQGVTRTHAIELTLPAEAPRQGPLYLVGQGWVHPTDSSINVALAQGQHEPPMGLSLEVADAQGRFRPVKTNLGFPSGKDKTILIDLSGVLPTSGERRLRLSTNLEIYWDRLAWAVGRPDVEVTPRRLTLMSADLRYRGFSPTSPAGLSVPERPTYAIEGTSARWLNLEGPHTRWGDVRELLGGVDDRYVIMNAGDELELRFAEVPAPGAGLVRDFIVIADGWVKDGDFNTTASRTVWPLPTHADGRYDRPAGSLENDPVYRRHADDFATYHTRYVMPDARRALRHVGAGGPSR